MKVSLNPPNNGGGVKANRSVELNRGITPGLCIPCFSAGWPHLSKRERDRETEKEFNRQTFTWAHEEKKYS